MEHAEPGVSGVAFREALAFWVRLGFVNFGGPTGQIALMHTELVERRGWIDERRFLHALNFAMLLPGPEAHQLAIYIGWLLNGSAGALVAGLFFLLPAFVLMVALSWIFAVHGDVAWVSGVFEGLAWGVVGIVAAALLRIGSKTLTGPVPIAIAATAFMSLFVFGVPFPLVVLGAGALGLLAARSFAPTAPEDVVGPEVERVRPTLARTARVLVVGLAIWLVPLGLVVAADPEGVLAQEAVFFATMALVTFGGAYAVLSYVQQAAVVRFGWLSSSEMAVGLSLAETTPGPLILTVVFVGFLAAYRDPGSLPAGAAGLAGALVTAWATFVPSFLFIFLGAPSVERLRDRVRLAGALAAITAAVVGVVANLAVVFATSVLFEEVGTATPFGHEIAVPELSSFVPLAAVVAVASFVAIRRFRVGVAWVVLGAGAVGLLDVLVG